MVDAICYEAELRKSELAGEQIQTIYFGGGTPSLLNQNQLKQLLDYISTNFDVASEAEVTLECNPDDLSPQKLEEMKLAGINRLSIGIQSFDDEILRFMNRAHDAGMAKDCIVWAKNAGFENITIDLIYGVMGTDLAYWKRQLNLLKDYSIPHLSAYCMTIETQTYFGHQHLKGKLDEMDEQQAEEQFKVLISFMQTEGYEQYEISNFAKKGFISQHNSAYWRAQKYLGLGPSAHSYNGDERSWNIANNAIYLREMKKGIRSFEKEVLSSTDKFNDYVLTRLRTKWGLELDELEQISPEAFRQISPVLKQKLDAGVLVQNQNNVRLAPQSLFIADAVSADLFC